MKNIDMLILNGSVLLGDPLNNNFRKTSLAIDNGIIIAIEDASELQARYSAVKVIDAAGKYIYPGFVCTHTHLFQTLFKGLGKDKPLLEWLDASIRPALKYITSEAIHYAALLGLVELIRCGVTTVADYQYCHVEPDMDKAVVSAYEKLGVRGVLFSARTDVSHYPDAIRPAYCETEEQFFEGMLKLHELYKDNSLITIGAAPGIIWDMSEKGYKTLAELQQTSDLQVSMHCLETEDDDEFSLKTFGKSTMEFLETCGILQKNFLMVHAVHMSEQDFAICTRNPVAVSHCPLANMLLASGTADIPRMLASGIPVSLATDGAASNDSQDMFEVMKFASMQQKLIQRDASVMSAPLVTSLATLQGAKALGLADKTGSLETGKQADLCIYNPMDCRSIPLHDPLSTLIYSSGRHNIEATIIQGRVVYQQGIIPGIDETDLYQKLQQLAVQIRKKAQL